MVSAQLFAPDAGANFLSVFGAQIVYYRMTIEFAIFRRLGEMPMFCWCQFSVCFWQYHITGVQNLYYIMTIDFAIFRQRGQPFAGANCLSVLAISKLLHISQGCGIGVEFSTGKSGSH